MKCVIFYDNVSIDTYIYKYSVINTWKIDNKYHLFVYLFIYLNIHFQFVYLFYLFIHSVIQGWQSLQQPNIEVKHAEICNDDYLIFGLIVPLFIACTIMT